MVGGKRKVETGIYRLETSRGTRYEAVWEGRRDPVTGARKQERVRVFTRDEARTARSEGMTLVRKGATLAPSAEPLATYLARWLDEAADGMEPSTVAQYRRVIKNGIAPHIGGIPLGSLTAIDVQGCYRARRAGGAKPETVRQTHALLHRALTQAVRWKLIPSNPVNDTEKPKVPKPLPKALSLETARAFVVALTGHPDEALWRLALDSGMRLGELLALRWGDIDLISRVVTVCRIQQHDGTRWTVADRSKSDAGRRQIVIAAETVAALETYRTVQVEKMLRAGPEWGDRGLVFPDEDGMLLGQEKARRRLFAIQRAHGLVRFTPHCCRHSMATLALRAGVHPKLVQARLGHASIAQTLDRYSHVVPAQQSDVADVIAGLLAPATDQARHG